MANAAIDGNNKATLTAALDTDPSEIVRIQADPSTHYLEVDDGNTGTDNGNNEGNALTDESGRWTLTAVSSDGSGERVIVYGTADGKLMIDSS